MWHIVRFLGKVWQFSNLSISPYIIIYYINVAFKMLHLKLLVLWVLNVFILMLPVKEDKTDFWGYSLGLSAEPCCQVSKFIMNVLLAWWSLTLHSTHRRQHTVLFVMSASETTNPSVVSLTEKNALEQEEFVSALKTGSYYGWPGALYINQGWPPTPKICLPLSSWNAETKDEHHHGR